MKDRFLITVSSVGDNREFCDKLSKFFGNNVLRAYVVNDDGFESIKDDLIDLIYDEKDPYPRGLIVSNCTSREIYTFGVGEDTVDCRVYNIIIKDGVSDKLDEISRWRGLSSAAVLNKDGDVDEFIKLIFNWVKLK